MLKMYNKEDYELGLLCPLSKVANFLHVLVPGIQDLVMTSTREIWKMKNKDKNVINQ